MKKVVSILLALVLSLGMVSLSACGLIDEFYKEQSGHEHEYLKFLRDEYTHTGLCVCEDTAEPEPHVDLDGDNKCDICNYEILEKHTHSYGNYVKNKNEHYKECSCGDKIENGAHKDSNTDYVCDVCGYELERPATHTHSYGNYVKNKNRRL